MLARALRWLGRFIGEKRVLCFHLRAEKDFPERRAESS